MLDRSTKFADAPARVLMARVLMARVLMARVLMALIFILSGVGKIGAPGFSVDQFQTARRGV